MSENKVNRPWLRIRLRSLLLLTAVFAAGFGVLVHHVHRLKRDTAVLRELDRRCGMISGRNARGMRTLWFDPNDWRDLSGKESKRIAGDSDLKDLQYLSRLEELYLDCTNVTDSGMAHIGAISGLKRLDLHNTAVTDDCIEVIAAMDTLEYVDLRGTMVSRPAIRRLSRLRPDLVCASMPHDEFFLDLD